MREISRTRETLRSLSARDLSLRLVDDAVIVQPRSAKPVRLPLKVITGRSPDVARQASAEAFNVFVDAGPRLTSVLRDSTRRVKGVGTSTGLLRLRLPNLLVDIERSPALPARVRKGPKLQGLSELVAEALVLQTGHEIPSLEAMAKICSGALAEGPSIAQIQKVLARLETEQIISVDRSRGPRFTRYFGVDKAKLLDLWSREYMPSASRVISLALFVTARDPQAVLAVVKRAKLSGRWAVGGPAAAQMWRPLLTSSPAAELWVDDFAWEDAIRLGVAAEEGGANLTVRRLAGGGIPLWFAHHEKKAGLPLVSPARAFVETAMRRGPRLDELADAVLESIA